MTNNVLKNRSAIGRAFGPLTVAFIGDSHVQRLLGTVGAGGAICNPGNDSVWAAAMAFMKAPWRIVGVAASDGARFEDRAYDGPDLLERTKPSIAVLALGINDFNQALYSYTVESRLEYVRAYLRQMAALRGLLVVATVPATTYANSDAEVAAITEYNYKLLQMAENNPHMLVVNISAINGAHDVSGTYATISSSYSADNLHWNPAGCVLVGREIARQLSTKSPLVRTSDPFVNNMGATTGPWSLIRNQYNLGSGGTAGGVTGTIPANVETFNGGTNHAAASTLTARDATDPVPGNWIRLAVTQGVSGWAANTNRVTVRRNSLNLSGAGVPVGQWMEAIAEVRFPNATVAADGAPWPCLQFVPTSGSGGTVQTGRRAFSGIPVEYRAGDVLYIRTAPFQLETSASYRMDLIHYTEANNAAYTVDVGRFALNFIDYPGTII